MAKFKRLLNGSIWHIESNTVVLVSASIHNQYLISEEADRTDKVLIGSAFRFLRDHIMEESVHDLEVINNN